MLTWLKSLFSSGEKDGLKQITAEWKLSSELAPAVATMLQLPIRASNRTPETLYDEQPGFFSGYIAGIADVLGQSAGGSAGGNLSQNLALRLMIELFGQQEAEKRWPQLLSFMDGDSPEFVRGTNLGGQDGNRIINKGFPQSLGRHLGI